MTRISFLAATFVALASGAAAGPPASEATKAANAATAASLPADREDEDFAARGFIASWPEPIIRDATGAIVWNFAAYDFVSGPAPETVNPSLWRHVALLARHGLFKVHERVYQVRGFDVSNMSIILSRNGLILVDPLTSVEAAKAALALARKTVGDKPVVAVIYTHSHADHFAGVKGVVDSGDVASGRVRIIAPAGFLEHAVSENVIAGNAMTRRATYQFGASLTPGADGQMTSGIGRAIAGGARSLIAPTETIRRTGEALTIDGVKFVFQMTPNTEAPAEMNFFLPEFGALCLAENANVSMHNVLTPRGALVRDSKVWADYLTEALGLYGDATEVMFVSHGWPRFGRDRIADYIASHRDAYKYLHDQSVRLMNMGLTGEEIAERIALPQSLSDRWFNRGYYGTMRHNSRSVYQRYMGWYDGNPAHLNALPHEATAARYVDAMGGARKTLKHAKRAIAGGDYRWAAELLDRLVFADPENARARALLAEAHAQMAYQAESAIWRNIYLSAAKEVSGGITPGAGAALSLDFVAATPSAMLFDLLSVRLNAEKAIAAFSPPALAREGRSHAIDAKPTVGARSAIEAGEKSPNPPFAPLSPQAGEESLADELRLNFRFVDRSEQIAVTIRNGVLIHEQGRSHKDADATVRLTRPQFLFMMLAPKGPAAPPPTEAQLSIASMTAPPTVIGDASAWALFRTLFDAPDPNFAIVTP